MTILNNFKDLSKVKLDGIKIVMWDMDGTIVSTEHLHALAVEELIEDKTITAQYITDEFCGQTDDTVFEALKNYMSFKDQESFSTKKSEVFKKLILKHKKSIIAPQILHFINFLKSKNITLALVTSSQREVMDLIFDILNLDQYFTYKRCFEDNELNKPSPAPYLSTLAQAKFDAHEAIIFEDSEVGYKAAIDSKVKEVYKVSWY